MDLFWKGCKGAWVKINKEILKVSKKINTLIYSSTLLLNFSLHLPFPLPISSILTSAYVFLQQIFEHLLCAAHYSRWANRGESPALEELAIWHGEPTPPPGSTPATRSWLICTTGCKGILSKHKSDLVCLPKIFQRLPVTFWISFKLLTRTYPVLCV